MNHKKIAVSIFLIAFAFGLNITGIMPILGVLNQQYASQGTSAVQLLQTLPYALLMVGSLLIGWLTSKFSKRNIALVGLTVIGVCGVLPFFLGGYIMLLLSRILIGFGFGIASPINTAIVAEFFRPEERPAYLGLHVVGMGVGSMAGNLAGGALAGFGYRWFYLVYMIAFISLLGVRILLPNTPPSEEAKQGKVKLNVKVYLISAASFVHTLFITVYNTNIAIYVLEQITENTAVTGAVTAVNAAFALMVGASFALISRKLGKYTLPVSILAAAGGYAALLVIPGTVGVYVGSACCGASLSCFMAQCSYMISISVRPEAVAKASGIFAVIGGIGGLISPIVLQALSIGIFGSNTTTNQFLISGIGMAALGIAAWMAGCQKREFVRAEENTVK